MIERAGGNMQRTLRFAVAGVLALAVTFVCASALQPRQAQAASGDKLTCYAQTKGSSAFKKAKMGKTAGKTGTKGLTAIKIAKKGKTGGNVSYTVGFASGNAKAKNGKQAAKKNKTIQYMSVKLSGKLKSTYNVCYRVYVAGYGWLGWAKNGAKAGSKGCKKDIAAYQVKLVAKKASQPNTNQVAFCKKGGFLVSISGDKAVDKTIMKVAKKCKMDLKKCFKWCAYGKGNVEYGMTGLSEIRTSGAWSAKRIKQEAKNAFSDGKGDCYTYAAAFYCLAKYLGYNAKPVAGINLYADGSSRSTSWTEVKMDGEWLFSDAMHADQVYMLSHKDYTQSYQYY